MTWTWTEEASKQLASELFRLGIASANETPVITPIGDGHSNLTYKVSAGGRSVIFRRPPPPPLPPGSNDVLREARIQSALGNTTIPVARILGTGEAGTLLDVPYYLMSMVDGEVITTVIPKRFNTPCKCHAIGLELIRIQAELHGIDWRAIGLSNLGRPEGFNARHLSRIAGILTEAEREAYPDLSAIQDWLERHCPGEGKSALIHNDCRIGNVMWGREESPRIAAVLDWELATIGDPMLDLAYTLASLPRDGICRQPVQDLAAACLGQGFPSSDTLSAHYFSLTESDPVALDWYLVMVNWKLAVLYTYSRRKGLDPYYQNDSHVPRFVSEAQYHAGL